MDFIKKLILCEKAITPTEFWRWFEANEQKFYKVMATGINLNENFLDLVSGKLQKVNSRFYCHSKSLIKWFKLSKTPLTEKVISQMFVLRKKSIKTIFTNPTPNSTLHLHAQHQHIVHLFVYAAPVFKVVFQHASLFCYFHFAQIFNQFPKA